MKKEIVYETDENGNRISSVPINFKSNMTTIAFFGDSFTENRRIDDRFTISSMLNELLGSPRIINFGVDGFGLEQSFQRYLNVEDEITLEQATTAISTITA